MVVADGPTLVFPLHGTLPTPLSMLQLVALVVDQERVDVSGGVAPRSMVVGLAVKEMMVGGHGLQVTAWPQLFGAVPHVPAHVTDTDCGVQPQTPAVPPPPQVTPVPVQVVQFPPPVPQASRLVPG